MYQEYNQYESQKSPDFYFYHRTLKIVISACFINLFQYDLTIDDSLLNLSTASEANLMARIRVSVDAGFRLYETIRKMPLSMRENPNSTVYT